MRSDERSLWWRILGPIVRPIERLLFRVAVEGVEHVPATGPAIIAFNHVSVLDGPCVAIETSIRRRREIRFLTAAEVFQRFFFGRLMRAFDQIPIRRGEGDAGALDAAIEAVRAGAVAALAPEGRVGDDPNLGLQRIRSGVARIALPTGAPVIPLGIWGTQSRWSRGGPDFRKLWRRHRLALVYGEPLYPQGDSGEDVDGFRERLCVALESQVERARELAEERV